MFAWLLKINPLDRNFYTSLIAIVLLCVLIAIILYIFFGRVKMFAKRVAHMGEIVLKSNSATEAYNNMEETVVTLNENGFIISCNPAIETMFGYEEEELIVGSQTIYKLLDDENWQDYENFKIFHVPLSHLECNAIKKNGAKFPVAISLKKGVGEIDKKKVLLLVTLRDISHRKGNEEFKMQKQLEASRMFSLIMFGEQLIKSGTWDWYLAADGNIEKGEVILTPNARKIFRIEEGKKTFATELMELLHDDDKETVGDAFMNAMANKENYRVKYRLAKRNNKYDRIDCIGTMVFDEMGEVIRIRGTIQIIEENVT